MGWQDDAVIQQQADSNTQTPVTGWQSDAVVSQPEPQRDPTLLERFKARQAQQTEALKGELANESWGNIYIKE